MRVTGGVLRGRKIVVPSGLAVRPMRSRIRQALFQILGDRVRGARVADLFAGSGALGIESLSRGARVAVFVERDRGVLGVLERNLSELGLGARAHRVAADAYRHRLRTEEPFHCIFLDPPFQEYDEGEDRVWTLAAELAQGPALAPEGWLCIELPSRVPPPEPAGGVTLYELRTYGDTALLFWRRAGA